MESSGGTTANSTKNRGSSGAYVPPHRRRAAAGQCGTTIPSSPTAFTPNRRRSDAGPHSRHYLRGRGERSSESVPVTFPPGTAVYCINLAHRADKWASVQRHVQHWTPAVQRWEAVNGQDLLENNNTDLIQPEWDATHNAAYDAHVTPGPRTMTAGEMGCAASHIQLWQHFVANAATMERMLILEDDVTTDRWTLGRVLARMWSAVPADWGMLYLGFSSRGPRTYVVEDDDNGIAIYTPTYGFHTHAYCLSQAAAETLLQHLPVCGPLDVWLADHAWFNIPTYCSVLTGSAHRRGWYDEVSQRYEGVNLIRQNKKQLSSDVPTSSSSNNNSKETGGGAQQEGDDGYKDAKQEIGSIEK